MSHRYRLISLFKDGSMTLKPNVGVQVAPVWPLACARRVKFLSTLALRCEYVPGAQERTARLAILYFMLIPFESMSTSFPGLSQQNRPSSTCQQPSPSALDKDCEVLERHGKSFTIHMRTQLLAPCPPSLHQPAKSLLEVPYPDSLPGISMAIWPSI